MTLFATGDSVTTAELMAQDGLYRKLVRREMNRLARQAEQAAA